MPSLVNGVTYPIAYPSANGTNGTVDFANSMNGISGAFRNRTKLGQTGAILFLKNDTDSCLIIEMQPSTDQVVLAPGDAEPMPIRSGDVSLKWTILYQNSFQTHPSEQLIVMFYDPADIASGHNPGGNSNGVNPPNTTQAQSVIGDFVSGHNLLGSTLQAYNPGLGNSGGIFFTVWDGTSYKFSVFVLETDGSVTVKNRLQFGSLLTGESISAVSYFAATGNGPVNHNLGRVPTYATICPTGSATAFSVGGYTSTQVTVSMAVAGSYRGFAIAQ